LREPAIIILATLFGVLAGSFLNVLMSRGPRKWGLVDAGDAPRGLAFPPSRCESCGRGLRWFELVPVVSFIALRGRCGRCGSAIGLRHLLVECLGGLIGVTAVLAFGAGWPAAGAAVLLLLLLTLAVIDAETGFLPDALTLPLILLGFAFATAPGGTGLLSAAAGAAIGGGGMWLLAALYERLRGAEGLGGGDVKLVAAGGAWCGAAALPFILLAASLSGLLFAGLAMLGGRSEKSLQAEIRFGPFLAAGIGAVYFAGWPDTLF